MICYDRSTSDDKSIIPGCIGGENDTTHGNYCVDPKDLPPSSPLSLGMQQQQQQLPFKLRLYWEDGYYWQESYDETFWCMACLPYGHCYDQSNMFI